MAPSTWREQIDIIRRELRSSFDHVTLLSDSPDADKTADAGFDGLAIYNNYIRPSSWPDLAAAASRRNIVFSFNINPGFDSIAPRTIEPDSCYRAPAFEPPADSLDWRGDGRRRAHSLALQRISESFEATVTLQAERRLSNARKGFFLAYICTFNEWHEGTAFEPAKSWDDLSEEERKIGYHNPGRRRVPAEGAEKPTVRSDRFQHYRWQTPRPSLSSNPGMTSVLLDLRHSVRSLLRQPGILITSLASLALGIGATSAIFSVAYAVLVRPLPYPEADRLVTVWETMPGNDTRLVAPGNYLDWHAEAKSFAALAAYSGTEVNVAGAGEAERVPGLTVSGKFFQMLGADAAVGRVFTAADDERSDRIVGTERGILAATVRRGSRNRGPRHPP